MGAITTRNITESETMIDDLESKTPQDMDDDKLAKLKAKMANKKEEGSMSMANDKSIKLSIIGLGQCGSRIAETWYKRGYSAIVMNTAQQDLKFIDMHQSNKLHLEYGVGGAAKDMGIGTAAANQYKQQITEMIDTQLPGGTFCVCTSLGGGSGAGMLPVVIDVLQGKGAIILICALPMQSDDAQTKANALETLEGLLGLVKSGKVQNIICVDNAKIETIYNDVGQMDFYSTANKAIVEPLDAFNTLTSMPSSVKSLDPMELSRIMIDSGGFTVYGTINVKNYEEDTAIAEAVISNLGSNLLAEGFDLKQSKYVGVIVAANKDVWAKIPASSVNYALAMIGDVCSSPLAIFRGVYTTDDPSNEVKVYSIFSGLGLPSIRITQLQNETKDLMQNIKVKNEQRNTNLTMGNEKGTVVSDAERIKKKVAEKNSAFGKFVANTTGVVDRRKP